MTLNDNKKKTYTILLMSAPIGSGHKLAAEALREAFAAYSNVKIVQGDVFSFFPQFLGKTFLSCYLWILKHFPCLYKAAYTWGNNSEGSLWLRTFINGVLARLGSAYLEKTAPDAVIATHATPAGIVSIYKKKLRRDLFLSAVVTDFTVHRWWLCDGVDMYFTASPLLQDKFPAQAETYACGIPVRRQFAGGGREMLRQKFGWQKYEKVCLLMGGGEGLLPMEEIIGAFAAFKEASLLLVALTGHNKRLQNKLIEKYPYVEVHGFTDAVPEMMLAADVAVTKAGGVTSAEVLAAGLDFIIYQPLPGQEEGNAAFLRQHYGAVVAADVSEVKRLILAFCSGVNSGEKKIYGKPFAAQQICEHILQRLETN